MYIILYIIVYTNITVHNYLTVYQLMLQKDVIDAKECFAIKLTGYSLYDQTLRVYKIFTAIHTRFS